jgi:phosphatidylglycerol lysyltransferase
LTKLGYRIEFHQPPLARSLLEQLPAFSDEWLRLMKGSEKRFSVGWFDEAYVRETPVAVVWTPDGTVSAVANLVSNAPAKGITIDLMRHRADRLNGTMDFLFIALF